jgi:hypothetical protein
VSIFECGDFARQDRDEYGYFAVNAKKYTKDEVIELYRTEGTFHGDHCFREPTLADIQERFVAHRCAYSDDGEKTSGYVLVGKKIRGSFPVWVIRYDDLEVTPYEI